LVGHHDVSPLYRRPTLSGDEWTCRKYVIDVHDYVNRREFLTLIRHQSASKPQEKTLDFLQTRLAQNPFFNSIPEPRQKRLLRGDDMFINGRHATLLKLGWGEEFILRRSYLRAILTSG
jgi:hypothetical protein